MQYTETSLLKNANEFSSLSLRGWVKSLPWTLSHQFDYVVNVSWKLKLKLYT